MIDKSQMIYEGKAKKIFATENPSQIIHEFKDSLTAFNAQKRGSFEGKGAVNLQITSIIFKHLSEKGVMSHFLKTLDENHLLVTRLEMIPLEVVVRNRAAGSFSKRLGVPEGEWLSAPLVEFYYKKDELADPLVTDDQIKILKLAMGDEIDELKTKALEINGHLKNFFIEVGIELIDFKLEFGRDFNGQILLADEVSPDSCRLWDLKTHEKLDKDRFRRDLGRVEESYKLVCSKIMKRWGGK